MKIDQKIIPKEVHSTGQTNHLNSKNEISGSNKFGDILDKTISGTEKVEGTQKRIRVDATATDSLLQAGMIRQGATKKVENLLTTMEIYKNALGNNAIDTSRLKELLQEMVVESNEMVETMTSLPDEDGLREIITNTAVSILTESNQYYGEYQ